MLRTGGLTKCIPIIPSPPRDRGLMIIVITIIIILIKEIKK